MNDAMNKLMKVPESHGIDDSVNDMWKNESMNVSVNESVYSSVNEPIYEWVNFSLNQWVFFNQWVHKLKKR